MKNIYYRKWQIILALISLFVLLASFYFEFVKNLHPCPLCIMQRYCVFMALGLGLIGAFCSYWRPYLLTFLQCFIALAGLYFASRQLWLQSLPANQMPACLPGLEILMRYFPWKDILYALFWGSGDCGEVSWRWLGLTMPAWSGLFFLSYLMIAGLARFSLRHRHDV